MESETRYNNRQIERMFDEQSSDLKEFFKAQIEPLARQVSYTNGRVRWQEKMIWLAMGALLIALPVLTWVTATVAKQQARIQAVVSQELEDKIK